MRSSIVAAAFLAATVSAHGNITSPAARLPGAAMVKACGQSAVNNVLQDGTIPLEDVFNALPSCKLDLCRGAVFEDNVARVQQFSLGQVIPFKAILPIPHEGPANVSIVKTATNQILGSPLLSFSTYADEKLAVLPANNTAFAVTLPTNLAATDCRVAGECVLQWFWFGTAAKQTYESCVDFVIAGGGSGVSSSAPSASTLVPVASTSSVASSAATAAPKATSTPGSFGIIPADAPSSSSSSSSSTSSSEAGAAEVPTPPAEEPAAPVEVPAEAPTAAPTEQATPPSEDSVPVPEASVPVPEPVEAAEGSFGGSAGSIPLVTRFRMALRRMV